MAHESASGIPRRTVELDGPRSGAPVRVVLLGDRGPTLTYFASSGGDQTEFERYGMASVCGAWLRGGRLRVVAVDARGPRTFWDDAATAAERLARYTALIDDLERSLVPFVRSLAGEVRLSLAGASYGAHVAGGLWLERPDAVGSVAGLGGVYGLRHRLPGLDDPAIGRVTPLERIATLDEGRRRALRGTAGVALFAAADDPWLPSSLEMARALRDAGLPHAFEVWPSPADHHERWWRDQLLRAVRRRFGAPPDG